MRFAARLAGVVLVLAMAVPALSQDQTGDDGSTQTLSLVGFPLALVWLFVLFNFIFNWGGLRLLY